MSDKIRSRIFHGGRFIEAASKSTMQQAAKEKEKLQAMGIKVRVKAIGGKHVVFMKKKGKK